MTKEKKKQESKGVTEGPLNTEKAINNNSAPPL